MTPKEAEEYYGKELSTEIWDNFDLNKINIKDTPEGLNIPKYEWEIVRSTLL